MTAPTSSAEVCLEARQAAVIEAALNRFELLKQAYAAKSVAYQSLLAGHAQDSVLLASSGHLIGWYKDAYAQEQLLRQDAAAKLRSSQSRATRRGLLVTVEAAVLGLLAYVIIAK